MQWLGECFSPGSPLSVGGVEVEGSGGGPEVPGGA